MSKINIMYKRRFLYANISILSLINGLNTSLTQNIHTLLNLEILILSQNNIKMIGTSFAHLKKLKLLDISYNQIYINESSIKVFKYNPQIVSLSLVLRFCFFSPPRKPLPPNSSGGPSPGFGLSDGVGFGLNE